MFLKYYKRAVTELLTVYIVFLVKLLKTEFTMNVKNLLLTWLNDYEKERVKPRTYTRYKSIIELHLSSTLGEVPLKDLKRRDVQQFLLDEKKTGI